MVALSVLADARSSPRAPLFSAIPQTNPDDRKQVEEWTAKEIRITWQDDFFEHRLRHDESRRQKANYILENPVRKQLVSRPEDWPYVYFGAGARPRFDD